MSRRIGTRSASLEKAVQPPSKQLSHPAGSFFEDCCCGSASSLRCSFVIFVKVARWHRESILTSATARFLSNLKKSPRRKPTFFAENLKVSPNHPSKLAHLWYLSSYHSIVGSDVEVKRKLLDGPCAVFLDNRSERGWKCHRRQLWEPADTRERRTEREFPAEINPEPQFTVTK